MYRVASVPVFPSSHLASNLSSGRCRTSLFWVALTVAKWMGEADRRAMMPNLRTGAGHDPPVGAAEAAAAKSERMTLESCMVDYYWSKRVLLRVVLRSGR
jgi:hypothetical protein